MLKDGLYELYYRALAAPEGCFESMLLVLRDGKVLGADTWGGVCLGNCSFDPRRGRYQINLCLHVPPGGVLITDDAPRPQGGTIEIGAEMDDPRGYGSTLVEVCGQPVSIELQFRGPAPS